MTRVLVLLTALALAACTRMGAGTPTPEESTTPEATEAQEVTETHEATDSPPEPTQAPTAEPTVAPTPEPTPAPTPTLLITRPLEQRDWEALVGVWARTIILEDGSIYVATMELACDTGCIDRSCVAPCNETGAMKTIYTNDGEVASTWVATVWSTTTSGPILSFGELRQEGQPQNDSVSDVWTDCVLTVYRDTGWPTQFLCADQQEIPFLNTHK